MAMPQRPVGLDIKLSQPNVGLIYPLNYDKNMPLMSTANWRYEQQITFKSLINQMTENKEIKAKQKNSKPLKLIKAIKTIRNEIKTLYMFS